MENKTKKLTIASMLLALGIILPQAFHMIPNAGNILLPMHIPVLISGFICGPFYGFVVGLLTPLLSHLIFSMPSAIMIGQMLIELAVYGFVSGYLNYTIKMKNGLIKNYVVLICSMLIGRFIYGLSNALIIFKETYSLNIWLSTAFITSFPGIMIQLIIIPILIKTINK